MSAKSAVHDVLCFALGSTKYRAAHAPSLVESATGLTADGMMALLSTAHLLGAFVAATSPLADGSPLLGQVRDLAGPALRARAVFNRNLLAEISHLGQCLTEQGSGAAPLVLKGVALWDGYYADGNARRVRDLDLYLATAADVAALSAILEREGYDALSFEGDDRDAVALFEAGETYSLPPFRIRRRADADGLAPEDELAARTLGEKETGLAFPDADGPVMDLDIELHSALLATIEGRFIRPTADQCAPLTGASPFTRLKPAAMLAYAATKFEIDSLVALHDGEGVLKCLKLAADCCRIVERCDQDDLSEALAIADGWGCLHHLIGALQSVAPLIPELRIAGLPRPKDATLLTMLLDAAHA
jgi:hypothetical protein